MRRSSRWYSSHAQQCFICAIGLKVPPSWDAPKTHSSRMHDDVVANPPTYFRYNPNWCRFSLCSRKCGLTAAEFQSHTEWKDTLTAFGYEGSFTRPGIHCLYHLQSRNFIHASWTILKRFIRSCQVDLGVLCLLSGAWGGHFATWQYGLVQFNSIFLLLGYFLDECEPLEFYPPVKKEWFEFPTLVFDGWILEWYCT